MEKIKGVILPSSSSGERITERISLYTFEDAEYQLELNDQEWKLRACLQKTVELKGLITKAVGEAGEKVVSNIEVKEYLLNKDEEGLLYAC